MLPESTLAQRIVRAKAKIQRAGIPLSVPARLDDRIEALPGILYLVFNAGALSGGPAEGIRLEFMEESIRLCIRLFEQVPENDGVAGLLTLEMYTRARSSARFRDGALVLVGDQDRSLWDRELITQADAVRVRSLRGGKPGPYAPQGAIDQCHCHPGNTDATNRPRIVSLYSALPAVAPTPAVALNHAVAVSMADAPLHGLGLLDSLTDLEDYYPYWATRGELLARSGPIEDALRDLARAVPGHQSGRTAPPRRTAGHPGSNLKRTPKHRQASPPWRSARTMLPAEALVS